MTSRSSRAERLYVVPDTATAEAGQAGDDILAMLLASNVEVVLGALRRKGTGLAALAAGRSMVAVAEDVLRALVADARAAGHTWQEVGDALHTTRQAAQQRFGEVQGATMDDDGAQALGAQAIQVAERWRDRGWDQMVTGFDDHLRAALGPDQLQAAWDKIDSMVGAIVGIGLPSVRRSGPFRVVDVPLACERGAMKARVTYGQDGRISGLFVLYPDAP